MRTDSKCCFCSFLGKSEIQVLNDSSETTQKIQESINMKDSSFIINSSSAACQNTNIKAVWSSHQNTGGLFQVTVKVWLLPKSGQHQIHHWHKAFPRKLISLPGGVSYLFLFHFQSVAAAKKFLKQPQIPLCRYLGFRIQKLGSSKAVSGARHHTEAQ